jgi:hypothetical protein
MLLIEGERRGWWTYESENPSGHVDNHGVEHEQTTYTVVLPGTEDADDVYTIGEDIVDGWLLRSAADFGPDVVADFSYQDGMVPFVRPREK